MRTDYQSNELFANEASADTLFLHIKGLKKIKTCIFHQSRLKHVQSIEKSVSDVKHYFFDELFCYQVYDKEIRARSIIGNENVVISSQHRIRHCFTDDGALVFRSNAFFKLTNNSKQQNLWKAMINLNLLELAYAAMSQQNAVFNKLGATIEKLFWTKQ